MVNEHHSTSTLPDHFGCRWIGDLARETKRSAALSLGTPIANRPDPVRVAEEMAWSTYCRARLEDGPHQGAPYEIAPANSNPANLMRPLLGGARFDLEGMSTNRRPVQLGGRFFHYRNVNILAAPAAAAHPRCG